MNLPVRYIYVKKDSMLDEKLGRFTFNPSARHRTMKFEQSCQRASQALVKASALHCQHRCQHHNLSLIHKFTSTETIQG